MSTVELPVRSRKSPCCAPLVAGSLSNAETVKLANRFRAVGDVTRLHLLDLIAHQVEPVCVCDLTTKFEQNQPTISHHLRLLREAGLIETEKRGIWGYYWATDAGRRVLAACTKLS
jgi:ArsR family transcriptional regulator